MERFILLLGLLYAILAVIFLLLYTAGQRADHQPFRVKEAAKMSLGWPWLVLEALRNPWPFD